jgi:predicted transport protein
MGDLKLFNISNNAVIEIAGTAAQVEKSLQALIESNLEAFLGVRLLSSEHATGKVHAGRIDTLGIDENDTPVVVEYKRSTNENVINQGLFYLDWLMDHRADFQLLAMKVLGVEAADKIDWSAPRLICIAGDFTRYDEHAVEQIGRNIELIRYRLFGDYLLAPELVNAVKAASVSITTPHPQANELLAFLKLDPASIELAPGFTRDVKDIGHFGTGDLEVRIKDKDTLERAKPLLAESYNVS